MNAYVVIRCCNDNKYIIFYLYQVDPNKPKKVKAEVTSDKGGGLNPMAVVILLIAIIAGVWFSQQ